MKIWRYVLEHNLNFAPHIRGGICSLVCCKPKIRKYAKTGDWIIGFDPGKRGGRAMMRYAMEVGEVMPLGEYDKKYAGRADAIYRYKPDSNELDFIGKAESEHSKPIRQKRDKSGVNAVVSSRYWYFNSVVDLELALSSKYSSDQELKDGVKRIHYAWVGQKYSGLKPQDIGALQGFLSSITTKENGYLANHLSGEP